MKKSKRKDFWDVSYNPVKGCGRKPPCPFCYARQMVKRLGYAEKVTDAEIAYQYGPHWPYNEKACKEYERLKTDVYKFKPTFFEYVLAQELRKIPTMYFFSMSDPAYWKQEWYERIAEKIAENMQHTFVILTKQPEIYQKYTFFHNTILGITTVNTFQFK